MIEAVVFDMDGVLIDSEPLWAIAEIEVFATVGIQLDERRCRETVGLGLDDVVELRFAEQPWRGPSRAEIGARIHRRVAELIRERGQAMPGALAGLAFARQRAGRVGLATASDPVLIEAVLDRLDIHAAFDHLQSADGLPHGKPHPEVYLRAAAGLGADPRRAVAIEDSLPGLIAAKAARMRAIAVPDRALVDDPRYAIADLRLGSLDELDESAWARLDR